MNDASSITGIQRSANSSIIPSHRRRHHHIDHSSIDVVKGKYNKSNFMSQPSAGISQNLHESSRRNLDNTELFSGGQLYSQNHELSALSSYNETTSSPVFNPRTNHIHKTPNFHKSFQNYSGTNDSAHENGYKPSFYSYYDVTGYSNDKTHNGSDYQQNELSSLNAEEQPSPLHFDAEFFPEVLSPLYSEHNRTLPNINGVPTDHLSFNLWKPLSDDTLDSFNNSDSSLNLNAILHQNSTNFNIAQQGIFSDYDYSIPSLNLSSLLDSDNNASDSGQAGSAQDLYTWSILMMAPLVIFGITGNTLVILAISLEKRLQNVTNYFLLSLAVTDLLVSLIVMPFSIINVLTGRWLFGLLLCDFFVTSDVLMCTSSILHLCTISLERYIGIRYPLWTKNKSKRIVFLKIVLVWTISLAISSPITILGVVKEDNVLVGGECVLNNEYFIVYGSIFAFYIPLAIMVLMYALTVRMLNRQARLCNSRPAEDGEGQPMIRRSTSRRNWQARRKYYGREGDSTATYSGERIMDGGMAGMFAPFHQRYRSAGVKRNNTIPMYFNHHKLQQHSEGGGNSTTADSNNIINSIQRIGSYNSPTAVNNNNKSNNCITDNSNNSTSHNSTSHNSANGRRNRSVNLNGVQSSLYSGLKPNFSYCNGRQEEITTDSPSDSHNCSTPRISSSSSSPSPTSSANRQPKRLRDLVRKHHVAVKAANILLMKRDSPTQGQNSALPSSNSASVRRDNSVRTEQKASKVLGVVFMIFVVCWAPFFTVNVLTALCSSCKFERTLITAFVWLGYVSSTLNPIIYTIFNNIFRITFIKLLCCRYRLLHRARRNSNLPGIRSGLLNCTNFCPAPLVTSLATNATSSTFLEESHC